MVHRPTLFRSATLAVTIAIVCAAGKASAQPNARSYDRSNETYMMAGDSADMEDAQQVQGATIRQQEEWAFRKMRTAVESPQHTDREREAATALENAWKLLEKNETSEDFRRALELTQQAAQSLPAEFEYLAEYLLGRTHQSLASSAAIVAMCSSSDPLSEESWLIADRTYRQSEHAKAAFHHLTAAITQSPNFAPAYACLCSHHERSGNTNEALHVAEKLVKMMPRCPEALEVRASCYTRLEQDDLALRDLRAAVQLSPKDIYYISRLASKLSEFGRDTETTGVLQSALDDVRADIEISPRDSSLYDDLGFLLSRLGKYDQAIGAYETAFEFADTDEMRGRAQYGIGIVAYLHVHDFVRALSAVTQAKSFGYLVESCDLVIDYCRQNLR